MNMVSQASLYQIGGSLQLGAPTYVTRRADLELYDGLRAGDFCYVLNCRQMGKSSLRVRVMAQLQAEGVACVAVQMTDIIDEEITPEQFYAGVVDSITQDLGLDFDNMEWWEANRHLSLVNRFSKFLETVLLQQVAGNLVIFIDEIDRVLSMPFKVNGFFAAIRECYNKRADNPIYRRLTFALLGVATPSDLIEDKRSTPFNIGRAIELTGFTLGEAQPLGRGLGSGLGAITPTETLEAILRWTGGQPFLTQKVYRLVAESAGSKPVGMGLADWVNELIDRKVVQNWQSNDEPEHLRTIRDRMLQDESRSARRLGLYQQILAQDGLPTNSANIDHIELRLSGLVVEQQGRLRVYNPIYAAIFNSNWAAHSLASLRPYARAITAWLGSHREDKSTLLQGQALSAAKQWSEDKVLPPEDYAFLAASQDLVTEETEEARQTLALANRTLEEANREATDRIKHANRRLRIGSGILLSAIALATIAGGSAFQINASARAQRAEAEQQIEEATGELGKAQLAREQAEADKQTAEKDKEGAQAGLNQAKSESERIRQASAARIADAEQQIENASVQARQAQGQTRAAQVATQQAMREQRLARQEADKSQGIADVAQAQATEARQARTIAQAEQERIQKSIRLERRGIALLRRPEVQFTGLDTLLEALAIGQELNQLLVLSTEEKKVTSIGDYPAISPLLALRKSLNSILGDVKVEGSFPSFSEDGQRLVTDSGSDNTSWLYDLSGQLIASFEGSYPSFSEDGQRLVTDSYSDNTSRLYDLSGQLIASLEGSFPSFSEDGQRLVTFSYLDNTSWLYDLSGQLIASLEGSYPSFSEDGQRLVTDSYIDNTSRLYDLSGQLIASFEGRSPSFSEDGQRLVR